MKFFRVCRTLLLAYGVFDHIGHLSRNMENGKIEKIKLDLEVMNENVALKKSHEKYNKGRLM